MATNIVKHVWNEHEINQRSTDGYVNLTDMARAEGRRVGDYLDLPSTKAYISALAEDLGALPDNLVTKKRGGRAGGETFAHPEIAIDFAQWVSMPFRIWANRTLRTVIQQSTVSQEEWDLTRNTGKEVRRTFTDAVRDYVNTHPNLSENAVRFMYPNSTDLVNLSVFGRKGKRIAQDWGCPPKKIRNHMTARELQWVSEVEDLAARLIDHQDVNPCEAVKIARERLLIQLVVR